MSKKMSFAKCIRPLSLLCHNPLQEELIDAPLIKTADPESDPWTQPHRPEPTKKVQGVQSVLHVLAHSLKHEYLAAIISR